MNRFFAMAVLACVLFNSRARGADDAEGPKLGASTDVPTVGATLLQPRFDAEGSAETIVTPLPQFPVPARPSPSLPSQTYPVLPSQNYPPAPLRNYPTFPSQSDPAQPLQPYPAVPTYPAMPLQSFPAAPHPPSTYAHPLSAAAFSVEWTPDFDGNLFVSASGTLLNRLMSRDSVVSQPVRDFILGADVFGQQTTTTHVQVQLRPCRTGALAQLQLEGLTQSRTVGVTPQASVHSASRFKFCATKDIFFNGERFWTRPSRITVYPSNKTLGAQTKLTCVPLLGGLADRYAVHAAEKKRPEAEAIGSQKLSSRVLPEFNSTVEKGLGEASYKLEFELRRKLREVDALPTVERMWTTDAHVFYGAFHASPSNPTGNPPPRRTFKTAKTLSVYVHESLINNFVDRLRLEGRSMTEPEFARILRNLMLAFSTPPGQDSRAMPVEEDDEKLVVINFDEKDPIRFRIEEKQLVLLIRAGFAAPGHEPVPIQLLTIPVEIGFEDDQFFLNPGRVTVTGVDDAETPDGKWGEIVRERIIIKSRIGKRVPQMRIPREIPLAQAQEGNPGVTLRLDRFDAGQGWVEIVFE